MSDQFPQIKGHCPMGCGESLFIASGGYITCSFVHCPNPTAVADILEDRETEHIVEIHETTFTVRHPLRERLNDDLLDCDLHAWLAARSGPPARPGRYRAHRVAEGWKFNALPQVPA